MRVLRGATDAAGLRPNGAVEVDGALRPGAVGCAKILLSKELLLDVCRAHDVGLFADGLELEIVEAVPF